MLVSIVLVFFVLGIIVFSVSHKIMTEMAASATQNLNESLDLIKCTIEAILNKEAEYQRLMAQGIAAMESPEEYVLNYKKSETMVKLGLIRSGETVGVCSMGEAFTEEEMDFSAGGMIDGLPVSQSYLNYMGTWAYCIKCPVIRDGQQSPRSMWNIFMTPLTSRCRRVFTISRQCSILWMRRRSGLF